MEMKRWMEDNKGSENEREKMEGYGDKDVPRVRTSEEGSVASWRQRRNRTVGYYSSLLAKAGKKRAKVEKTKAGQTEAGTKGDISALFS